MRISIYYFDFMPASNRFLTPNQIAIIPQAKILRKIKNKRKDNKNKK